MACSMRLKKKLSMIKGLRQLTKKMMSVGYKDKLYYKLQ